jgi:hypothetical protein
LIELLLFFFYGLLLWFGVYLIQRDIKNPSLSLLGLSVFFSGLYYGGEILLRYSPHTILMFISDSCYYLSFMILAGAILFHLPVSSTRIRLLKIWGYLCLPIGLIARWYAFFLKDQSYGTYFYILFSFSFAIFLIFVLFTLNAMLKKAESRLKQRVLFFSLLLYIGSLVVMLFFSNTNTIYMLNSLGLLGIVFTLFIIEIKGQGERWFPDFIYSLDYTFLVTLVITGQVILSIWIGSSFQLDTIFLVLLSILISILAQASFRHVQTGFEYFVFITFPKLRQERSRLRTSKSVQLIVNKESHPEEMDEEKLYHFTRRAFSHFGDLQRLSSNPLTQLKIIDQRLNSREKSKDVLERANELKSILSECVQQLKPHHDQAFGTTDEWRFYNSLYFPYVIGIKPYSKRYTNQQLGEDAKEALDWFRTCVPERTFYHWTNTAARLVAVQLRNK